MVRCHNKALALVLAVATLPVHGAEEPVGETPWPDAAAYEALRTGKDVRTSRLRMSTGSPRTTRAKARVHVPTFDRTPD